MTTVHLVRHATCPVLGTHVLAGRSPGHGLDAAGVAQADRLARSLAGRPVARIVSGPLERARDTAAPVGRHLGIAVEVSPLIDEIDYGTWTGRDWRELEGDEDWVAWNARRGSAAIPGGETIGAVSARALALVRDVARAVSGGGEAVLVTHADVVRATLASVLGLAPELSLRLAIDPASRSVLRVAADGATTVLGVNLPP